ncbi:MAG: hypothetical protein ABI861_00310 [Panacibacter sp.]
MIITDLANIFTPSPSNIFFMAGLTSVLGLLLGFLIKSGILSKHKKRIITLEDEMLANHSRILDLEKKLAELREENARIKGSSSGQKAELKVS